MNRRNAASAHQRPLAKRVFYVGLRAVCRLTGVALFGLRCQGRQHVPSEGGVLVCSNHQSFFDPVLVGMCCNRRLNYLARKSLFRFFLFRWLIQFLDAIPIDRDGMGLEGIKETLRRLKRDEMVLIFPEGTRTRDGEVSPIKPGFVVLAKRVKAPLLPVAIDGAYDAWPRSSRTPQLSDIHVEIGEAISPSRIAELSDRELIAELEQRIRDCHHRARQSRLRQQATRQLAC